MTPPVRANSYHLRLARRALRTAITHLRDAANRCSMSDATQIEVVNEAFALEVVNVAWTHRIEAAVDAHLEAQVAKRRKSRVA